MGFAKSDGGQRDEGHVEPIHQIPALNSGVAEGSDEQPEDQEGAGKENLSLRRLDIGQPGAEAFERRSHSAETECVEEAFYPRR